MSLPPRCAAADQAALRFFSSPETPYNDWADPKRVAKYQAFFGPGIDAEVTKVDAEARLVAIELTKQTANSRHFE